MISGLSKLISGLIKLSQLSELLILLMQCLSCDTMGEFRPIQVGCHTSSTIRAPHFGQAPLFGQSQSGRDIFRLGRLVVEAMPITWKIDSKIKLGCGILGGCDKQLSFYFVKYQVLYYNNMHTV